jgi:hypothetical protein
LERSAELTVGTPDVNGATADATGYASFRVAAGNPGTPADEADVALRVRMTDVRAAAGLTDYTGQLQAAVALRITDRNNPAAAGSHAGTTQSSTFYWTVPCVATTDTTVGSTCSIDTSADALTPGTIVEGDRAVWDLGQVRVLDGGPDGLAGTAPNTIFARQGVFVP